MTTIAQQLKTDKRTKSLIKARVLKTKVLLTYNNFEINLKQIDAKKIAHVLSKAIAIQETKKHEDQASKSSLFSNKVSKL